MLNKRYLSVPCYKEFPVATYVSMLQFLKDHCLQGRTNETNNLFRITCYTNFPIMLSIVGDFLPSWILDPPKSWSKHYF